MEITTISTFTNEDIFVCGQCKSVFTLLVAFLEHKKTPCSGVETERITYEVTKIAEEICEDNSNINVNCNIETTSQESQFVCDVCHKVFKKSKSLELHEKNHTRDRAFQCPICGRCFVQGNHLPRHLHSHKVWPDGLGDTTPKTKSDELLSYACPYCEAILQNYVNFRKHLKDHVLVKKFKCIQGGCVNLYDDVDVLLEHVSQNHVTPTYSCYICSGVFSSLDEIAVHQRDHKKSDIKCINKFKCMQCDAVFRSSSTLALHMFTDNHKKTCIHCSKIFSSEKRLRLHLQIHRNSKTYTCETCNANFRLKKYLDSHLLKHGNRNYICEICNFKFKRQDYLTRHLKTHMSIKKLQCPYREELGCKMAFTRRDKLKLHIKSHINKMVVVCEDKSDGLT